MANLPHTPGSRLMAGPHPVIIVSNEAANKYSPVITVVPISSQLWKMRLPTHILLQGYSNYGLDQPSFACCELMVALDVGHFDWRIGAITNCVEAGAINRGLSIQLDLYGRARMEQQDRTLQRMELWMADFPYVPGSHLMAGCHPVVIVSNRAVNKNIPVVTVVPVSSQVQKMRLPTHKQLEGYRRYGLDRPSFVSCELVVGVDADLLYSRKGTITDSADVQAIAFGLGVQLGLNI